MMEDDTTVAAKDFDERLNNALKSIGASVESMSNLAGAVLQIAKQTLSLRYDGKPVIASSKMIGSQSISEVIWEGRNHSMHRDEGEPRGNVQNMLNALSNDLHINIEAGKNNSLSILGAFGWKSELDVIADLEAMLYSS